MRCLCRRLCLRTSVSIQNEIEGIVKTHLRPNDNFGVVPNATYQASMVLLIGNHSAGKSTFINRLLGRDEQLTGVAPTDDGFTVIMRSDIDLDEDGPSAVSNPKNQFQPLQSFGPSFVNRFKVKMRRMPAESRFPEGTMIVDSPGMIDTPIHTKSRSSVEGQCRGYDFLGAVQWLAKRSDVILLFFDPANPGTTGETLDVLTKSLAGMEHKFLILLNKVDIFDTVTDFARTYGTICWNLSKVIPMKDIPRIYTTYTPTENQREGAVSLKEMERARREVLEEVQKAPLRRLDNILTEMDEAAKRVLLAGRVCNTLRRRFVARQALVWIAAGVVSLTAPALAMAAFFPFDFASVFGVLLGTGVLGGSFAIAANRHLTEYGKMLILSTDAIVTEYFPGSRETEDAVHRWQKVVPQILNEVDRKGIGNLPSVSRRALSKIESIIADDVPFLRTKVAQYKEQVVRAATPRTP